MESPGRSGDAETLQETEGAEVCLCPPSCSAHDITSMSDLPARRMKTKMWPMSPIETLTQEEVLSIANRDRTPVMIAVLDGDASREQYLCSNKRGASLPPEVAAEGSWARKYYQQVAVLTDSLKEMQESFQPVWELAKSQQALLVSVEIFDGLLAIANQGMQVLFKSWSLEARKAIITKECDFRTHKQADYYTVLKNYTMKRFESLDRNRFQSVEDLLTAGETHLMHHARMNGFECPSEVRESFQEFLPLKRDRNQYSHPLTLARKPLASSVLQKLRASLLNDEFDFIRGTKKLILLGADYAETVLANYGKVRQKLFLDPNKRCPQRSQSNCSQEPSPQGSPGPASPRTNPELASIGQNSQSLEPNELFNSRSSESPLYSSLGQSSVSPLGSPLVLTYPEFSESIRTSQQVPALQIPPSSPQRQSFYIGRPYPRSPESSPSSPSSHYTHSTDTEQSSGAARSPRKSKRRRL